MRYVRLIYIMVLLISAGTVHSQQVSVVEPSIPVPGFNLVSGSGYSFTRSSLEGKFTLMFFGYTNCPDVCPTGLATVKAAIKLLVDQYEVDPGRLQVVFVTLDPDRDKSDYLSKYVAYFDDDFTGLTGSYSEIDKLASALGVKYEIEDTGPDQYVLHHTADMMIIDPSAHLIQKVRYPQTVSGVAGALFNVLKANP